jgi:hypothetical protein
VVSYIIISSIMFAPRHDECITRIKRDVIPRVLFSNFCLPHATLLVTASREPTKNTEIYTYVYICGSLFSLLFGSVHGIYHTNKKANYSACSGPRDEIGVSIFSP